MLRNKKKKNLYKYIYYKDIKEYCFIFFFFKEKKRQPPPTTKMTREWGSWGGNGRTPLKKGEAARGFWVFFFNFAGTSPCLCNFFGRFTPFISFGTAVAILLASTWFHKPNQRAAQRFSGPACRPFLLDGPLFGLGGDQLLQFAAFEHLHHDVRSAHEFTLHI